MPFPPWKISWKKIETKDNISALQTFEKVWLLTHYNVADVRTFVSDIIDIQVFSNKCSSYEDVIYIITIVLHYIPILSLYTCLRSVAHRSSR